MTTPRKPENNLVNFKAGKHFLMPGYKNYMKTMFTAVDKPGQRYDLTLSILLGEPDGKCCVIQKKNIPFSQCQTEIDSFVEKMDSLPQDMKDVIIDDYNRNY